MDSFATYVQAVAADLSEFDPSAAEHLLAALEALEHSPLQNGRTALFHACKVLEHAAPVFADAPGSDVATLLGPDNHELVVLDPIRGILLQVWTFGSQESQRNYETEVADFEPRFVVGVVALAIEYLIKWDDA